MRAARLLALLTASLTLGASPSGDPFDIWDNRTVLMALEEAESALAEELGGKIPKRPRILLSSREFMEGVLYRQMKEMSAEAGPQDARALRMQAKIMSRSLFGLYEPERNTVHLMPENFWVFSKETGNDDFTKPSFLRLVLIHELVHAWDVQRHDLVRRRKAAKGPEQKKVWFALAEGHAEWVTQRIAEKIGLGKENRLLAQAAFSPPPGLPPAEQPFAWRATASIRFGYVDGHRFFTGLEAWDHEDPVGEVFENPPASASIILHPTRYFVPEETAHFPDEVSTAAALDAVLARELPGGKTEAWAWDEQMMKARLVMLPPRSASNLLAKLVKGTGRAASSGKKGPPAKVLCSTAQMTDAAAAKDLFEAVLESERLEDEAIAKLTGGRVESGRVSGPLRPRSPMPHNRTMVFVGEGKNVAPQYTVIFAAGPFVAECILAGPKRTDGELEDLITFFRARLVEAARAPSRAPAPATAAPPAAPR